MAVIWLIFTSSSTSSIKEYLLAQGRNVPYFENKIPAKYCVQYLLKIPETYLDV